MDDTHSIPVDEDCPQHGRPDSYRLQKACTCLPVQATEPKLIECEHGRTVMQSCEQCEATEPTCNNCGGARCMHFVLRDWHEGSGIDECDGWCCPVCRPVQATEPTCVNGCHDPKCSHIRLDQTTSMRCLPDCQGDCPACLPPEEYDKLHGTTTNTATLSSVLHYEAGQSDERARIEPELQRLRKERDDARNEVKTAELRGQMEAEARIVKILRGYRTENVAQLIMRRDLLAAIRFPETGTGGDDERA